MFKDEADPTWGEGVSHQPQRGTGGPQARAGASVLPSFLCPPLAKSRAAVLAVAVTAESTVPLAVWPRSPAGRRRRASSHGPQTWPFSWASVLAPAWPVAPSLTALPAQSAPKPTARPKETPRLPPTWPAVHL